MATCLPLPSLYVHGGKSYAWAIKNPEHLVGVFLFVVLFFNECSEIMNGTHQL